MTGLLQILYSLSLLVFLFPLALYCLALAYINRSRRPVLVSGLWDCIALVFGLSGFLLWTVPGLIGTLTGHVIDLLPGGDLAATWNWGIRIGYSTLLALVITLMLVVRRHKTAVYNVDTDRFGERLTIALANLGLDSINRSGRLIIAPAEAFSTVAAEAITADPARVASTKTLRAAGRPALRRTDRGRVSHLLPCHAALGKLRAPLRREIERELPRTLADAVAVDNPAAGWFLGFSGLIFGTVIMFALLVTAFMLWRPR